MSVLEEYAEFEASMDLLSRIPRFLWILAYLRWELRSSIWS